MRLENLKQETAQDLIKLINGIKGLEKKGGASFKAGNSKKSYKWVLLDDILDIVKENKDFALMQPLGQNENCKPALKNILIHKSGEIIASDWFEIGYKESDTNQNKGVAITYMRRYSLGAFLGMASETDNDGSQNNEDNKVVSVKDKKKVTDIFNKMVSLLGSKEDVYKELGTKKETFIIEYNSNPKPLAKQMEAWLEKNNVE